MTLGLKHTWIAYITYLFCWRHTQPVQVTMTTSNTVLGQTATINCSALFKAEETNRKLSIHNEQLGIHFPWMENLDASSNGSTYDHSRYSMSVSTPTQNVLVMDVQVADLGCLDEGYYMCTASAGGHNGTRRVDTSHQLQIMVQVSPSAPSQLTVSPESSKVKEHEWVDILCRAVTGRDDDVQLRWKICRNRSTEYLSQVDPRIILHEAHPGSGVHVCTRQLTSKLRLQMLRRDHNNQVACYLDNPVHHGLSSHSECACREKDFCAKTSSLQVHYGVREEAMHLDIFPNAAIKEGDRITLVCYADGYPPANYSWNRSSPLYLANMNLTWKQVGNSSWLLLTRFKSTNDAGVYKCVAWNWVLGVEFFVASQEITISTAQIQRLISLKTPDILLSETSKTLLVGIALSIVTIVTFYMLIMCAYCLARRLKRSHKIRSAQTSKDESQQSTDYSGYSDDSDESVTDQFTSGDQ